MKIVKRMLLVVTVVVTAVIALNVTSQQALAKSKWYNSVPTSLRGTWVQTKAYRGYIFKYKFTKYTLTQYGRRPGKSYHFRQKLSMKLKHDQRLGILRRKDRGYFVMGLRSGDTPMRFKRAKHKGKTVIMDYTVNPITGKTTHHYYNKR